MSVHGCVFECADLWGHSEERHISMASNTLFLFYSVLTSQENLQTNKSSAVLLTWIRKLLGWVCRWPMKKTLINAVFVFMWVSVTKLSVYGWVCVCGCVGACLRSCSSLPSSWALLGQVCLFWAQCPGSRENTAGPSLSPLSDLF